jgi:peptide chain release factor 1
MFDRLDAAQNRYRELEELMGTPDFAANPNRLRDVGRELAGLRETVEVYGVWKTLRARLDENQGLLEDPDPDIAAMAREEIGPLRSQLEELEARLKVLLVPRDPNDSKNVVLEVRAGTGGSEAALFAADLFRMYTRHAETVGWDVELMSTSQTDGGGFKEVVATISGTDVYRALKYESGVHRVQRVPATEAQGRIHTSTVTVAVLPEAEAVDVQLDEEKDLRIDRYRSSGPGGQSVNTTDSAVRITHLPTGLIVTCQDEKSQHKNRAKALKILRSRLFDMELQKQQEERASDRRSKIGTGERSERIRTYNFPQNRVTDHRVGVTLHKLDLIIEGDLAELIEATQVHFQSEALAASELGA